MPSDYTPQHAAQPVTSVYARASFWCGVGERALKTAAQTLAAVLAASTMIQEIDWQATTGAVILATLLSVATSIADPGRTDTATTTYGGGEDATMAD